MWILSSGGGFSGDRRAFDEQSGCYMIERGVHGVSSIGACIS